MSAWKLGPAFAAGCTVVLKPAEETPLTALFIGRLAQEAGFPDGVLNVVTGYGQTCCAGSRLFVHKSRFDEVVDGVANIARNMKVGPGLDMSTEIGPMVSKVQQDRVCAYIEAGKAEGAELLVGGTRPDGNGFFVNPTVFVNTSNDMKIVREEIFGPVLVAMPYTDLEEVIAWANDTPYGLGASIWTRDVSTVHTLAHGIRSGTVWVNCHNVIDAALPFGGFKESGWGRENGVDAVKAYCETQTVCIAL